MTVLPDPRPWGCGAHPWHALADETLSAALADDFARGADVALAAALADAACPATRARLWAAAARVAEKGADAVVVTRYFALPLVLVTGSRTAACLDGVVPDVAAVRALLEEKGAVGPARNVGLGNALVALAALEALAPLTVYRAVHRETPLPEFPPAPIALAPNEESVHLRFLVGAGIAPAAAPSFVETASNVAAWGLPFAQLLSRQLATAEAHVLVLPRPPWPILAAPHAGRRAQLEAAFNLFVGNELRRIRLAVGDPVAILSTHRVGEAGGELRITLSSPFDETFTAGFRWPLDAFDDVADIAGCVGLLLSECRVGDVRMLPEALPDMGPRGVPWFPTVRDGGLKAGN